MWDAAFGRVPPLILLVTGMLLSTVMCAVAPAFWPTTQRWTARFSGLLQSLTQDPVDSIVGKDWRSHEWGDRCHTTQAESESISS
jgi:hypothetical protein